MGSVLCICYFMINNFKNIFRLHVISVKAARVPIFSVINGHINHLFTHSSFAPTATTVGAGTQQSDAVCMH